MTIGNGVPWVDGNVIIFKYTILRTDGTEDDAKMGGGVIEISWLKITRRRDFSGGSSRHGR